MDRLLHENKTYQAEASNQSSVRTGAPEAPTAAHLSHPTAAPVLPQRRRPGGSPPSPRYLSAYTESPPSSSAPGCLRKPEGLPAPARGSRPAATGGTLSPGSFPASRLPALHRPSPRPHLPPPSFCFCFFVFLFASRLSPPRPRPPGEDPPCLPARRYRSPGAGSAARRKGAGPGARCTPGAVVPAGRGPEGRGERPRRAVRG